MAWFIERVKHASSIGKALFVIAALCFADGVGALVVPALPGWLGFDYFASHHGQYALLKLAQATFWCSLGQLFQRSRDYTR
jgi:hypothetical protein